MQTCEHVITIAQGSKDWVDYFSALLTPVIAVIGVAVGLNQWHTNRNRLKHELYQRRYAQFEAVTRLLGTAVAQGFVQPSDETDYHTGTRGVSFTYGREMYEYLAKHVWTPVINLRELNFKMGDQNLSDEERHEANRDRVLLTKDLLRELVHIEEKFAPYLELKH